MQLVINTYGTYVHVKDDLFEVSLTKEGERQKHQFASQKVTSILMSKGAALSTDAIILAMKNNIDIIVFENDGVPVGRFWHSRPGSTSKIRKQQLEASLNYTGVFWVKKWLTSKLDNQIDFLKRLKSHRSSSADLIQEKIEMISNIKIKMNEIKGGKIEHSEDWKEHLGVFILIHLVHCYKRDIVFKVEVLDQQMTHLMLFSIMHMVFYIVG
jgi:CRISPR-associated protein Cas1